MSSKKVILSFFYDDITMPTYNGDAVNLDLTNIFKEPKKLKQLSVRCTGVDISGGTGNLGVLGQVQVQCYTENSYSQVFNIGLVPSLVGSASGGVFSPEVGLITMSDNDLFFADGIEVSPYIVLGLSYYGRRPIPVNYQITFTVILEIEI